jgi:hypothetical protein
VATDQVIPVGERGFHRFDSLRLLMLRDGSEDGELGVVGRIIFRQRQRIDRRGEIFIVRQIGE